MVNWCLLALTALLCCVKDIHGVTYSMLLNGQDQGSNGAYWAQGTSTLKVACKISGYSYEAVLSRITAGGSEKLAAVLSYQDPLTFINYTLDNSDHQYDVVTYRCVDGSNSHCPDYAQLTISFIGTPRKHDLITPNCSPGGSNTPSVNPPPTPTTRPSTGPRFAGLNPLIYTISAVILLGTLAIVAIITCWIRARRSYNRRMFQSSANPQDYLDYINDNEFTPLTTSEFVASLQERPPTYNESEEIEGQMRPEGDNSEAGAGGGEAGAGAEGGGGAQTTTTTTTTTTAASTSTSTNARSRPPRPPPPLMIPNSNHSLPSTATTASGSSRTSDGAAATSSNGGTPDVTSEDRPPVAGSDGNEGGVPDITGDSTATGASSSEPVLSGIDALLSMDLSTGNGNGIQPLPVSSSSTNATESAAVGTLIDFGTSNSGTGAPVVSNSQSTFHSLPQPTPEQISEMEAAIGALNEHMTRIRERTE